MAKRKGLLIKSRKQLLREYKYMVKPNLILNNKATNSYFKTKKEADNYKEKLKKRGYSFAKVVKSR